jgi:hypothetical protein
VDLPAAKPLPDRAVLKVISGDCQVIGVTDVDSAIAALKANSVMALVCNHPHPDVFRASRAKTDTKPASILVTEKPMDQYSPLLQGEEDTLVDHVIANRSPSAWTVNELRVTLQKLLTNDIFGLEKYNISPSRVRRFASRTTRSSWRTLKKIGLASTWRSWRLASAKSF